MISFEIQTSAQADETESEWPDSDLRLSSKSSFSFDAFSDH